MTTAVKAPRRIIWVDYLKGIAIVLVVAGHVIGGQIAAGVVPAGNWLFTLRAWIYTFHMPAFFFISGMFIARSVQRGLGAFIVDKLRMLIYPYVLWSIIQWCCHMVMSRYTNSKPDPYQLLEIFYKPYMNLWFLYVLFYIMVLFALLTKARAGAWGIVAIGGVLFAAHAMGAGQAWDVFDSTLTFFLYFALGAALKERAVNSAATLGLGWLITLTIVCFGLLTLMVLQANTLLGFIPETTTPGWAAIHSLAMASLGCLGLFAASSFLGRLSLFAFIAWWGVESLVIYLAHGIPSVFCRIILLRAFHVESMYVQVVVGIAVGVALPLLLKMICDRLNFPYLFRLGRGKEKTAIPGTGAAGTEPVVASGR